MGLERIEVQSCCYFISLRTGTKLFGFLSMIGCLIAAILGVWELAVIAKIDKYIELILVVDLVAQSLQIVTAVFLLMGAYQEKAKLILPWMVATVIAAIMEVVFMPSLIGREIGIHHWSFTHWLVTTLILLFDDIYGLLVVFSYYRSLSSRG